MIKLLEIDEIRSYFPGCDEIRVCPMLKVCISKSKKLCNGNILPCYIILKNQELEGVIKQSFDKNLIAVIKFHEEEDYVKFVRPDGIEIGTEDKETVQKAKKVIDDLMKY